MAEKAKNVLSLNSKEAIEFFLKSDQYHGFELPDYYKFDSLLEKVKNAVGNTPYDKCIAKGASPEQLSDVNFNILLNKDGRYDVRPIMLANPFLYYFLVREICSNDSWPVVKHLFKTFKVPHITSCALPVVPDDKKKENFPKATTILNWWNSVEQRSVELSLEYRYMFVTDISNCYGSVNPQAFDWAFSFKGTQHETSSQCTIPKNIQKYLRAFQQGRGIGIPQGSAIFDLLAEIILGYADLLLHEAIEKEGITAAYEVIRYRDDYRIFCNDKDALERISYLLQGVLEQLNFRMNSKKTKLTEDLVAESIKPDKLAYIYNTPILNKKGNDFDSIEKQLLFILMFARKHPNSGTVQTLLSKIDKRITDILETPEPSKADTGKTKFRHFRQDFAELFADSKDQKSNKKENKPDKKEAKPAKKETRSVSILEMGKIYYPEKHLHGGSERAMAAICLKIALENVNRGHYALRVLSRIVNSIADEQEKWDIFSLVCQHLITLPNSAYYQIWLQNITYQRDKKRGQSPYNSALCKVVAGEKDVTLWNCSWLKKSVTKGIDATEIVDGETLKEVTPVISFIERGNYDGSSYQA